MYYLFAFFYISHLQSCIKCKKDTFKKQEIVYCTFKSKTQSSCKYKTNVFSDDKTVEWESAAFHLGYMLRRNIRLVGEYSYNIKDSFGRTPLYSVPHEESGIHRGGGIRISPGIH